MPVDPRRVDAVAAAVASIYSEAETALVRMISRRLEAGLDAGDWATRKLAETTAVRRAAQLIVDRVASRGSRAARAAVAEGYRAGNAAAAVDLAELTAGDVGPVARGADHRRGNAVQALGDALVAELRPAHEAILPLTVNAYRHAVAGATARHLAGGIDRRRAAQSAWAALVDRGITGFDDGAGRRWRLHTYVEMAVRTATSRAAIAGTVDDLVAAGEDLAYVTDTAGECSICRPWEHKVLALTGLAGRRRVAGRIVHVAGTLAEARAQGLFHPNCHHGLRLYVPGRTRLSGRTADPRGDRARQRQRELERHTRRWREREAAALTAAAAASARARVDGWETELERHTAEHDLPRLRYREHPGAGFVPPPSRRGDAAALLAPTG